MITTIGTIRYSPKTLGKQVSPNWWMIVDADPVIGKYYRELYRIANYRCQKLEMPAWDAHVTVVRNEEPPNKEFWEKYNGHQVELLVGTEAKNNGYYTWLDVECDFLLNLRIELGLAREPAIPLHLSIGHGYN